MIESEQGPRREGHAGDEPEGTNTMNRNRTIESQIKLFTDDWDLRLIQLADIDKNGSIKGQNRRATKTNDEHVFRIAEGADLGIELPPLIVNQVGHRFQIIDGNHRHAACDLLSRTEMAAYVVKVDPDLFLQMCLSANAWGQLPLPEADRIANALQQVRNGLPATTVAKMWGISDYRLQILRRQDEGRDKVAQAGLAASKLSAAAAELANRLEVAQIEKLGAELLTATARDLEDAVRAITAAPAADRDTESIRQSMFLEQRRQQRAAPKSRQKGAMTSAQARTKVKEVLIAIRSNHGLLNDRALVGLITDLAKEVDRGGAYRQEKSA